MHNTFGRFIIKGTYGSLLRACFLKVDGPAKPLTSGTYGMLTAEAVSMWERTSDLATVFPSTDVAMLWIAFALKHTNASAVEIIRL